MARTKGTPGDNKLEWAIASRSLPGESECGDQAAVISSRTDSLIAVVDGLGHGSAAAQAATLAIQRLREHAAEPLPTLMRRCHDALQNTRGVAMALALIPASLGTLTWLGIGNIQGRVVRANDEERGVSMMLSAGIAGDRWPRLHPARVQIGRGDLLLLATDGLRDGFADSLDRSGSVDDIAHRLLDEYHRPQDDSLVLVARYLSGRQ